MLTLRDLGTPTTFTPRDAALREAMQRSTIAIHPSTNLWRAWLGFNLSHSLGLVLFGGAYLTLALGFPALFVQWWGLQACAVLVSAAYLWMSLRFFFSKPALGSGAALACFTVAVILCHV